MPKIRTNVVYDHLEESYGNIRALVEQGGSRSGKTYNILLWIIAKANTTWENKVVDIVRKSFPSLRMSAMFDFFKILNDLGIYSEKLHNKTENIYTIGSNKIRFFSCDEPQKMRGPGRDILFCNEANELSFEDFTQLNMRTREFTIVDYNPSEEFHWLYEKLIPRDDSRFERTNYIDNPFLPQSIVDEIEHLKEVDENYWRIYGLGERGVSQTSIFTQWELVDKVPDYGEKFYGLDFGFNHPTALIEATVIEKEVYYRELLYESGLTVDDISKKLKDLDLNYNKTIYCDCARPEMIEQLYRLGHNVKPTKKGPDSVKAGIDIMKRHKIYISKNSVNLLKEFKSYKWKVDKDGNVLDEPVKLNDDAVDAARYALNEQLQGKTEFRLGRTLDVSF